jgi:hypothetical protein
MTSSLPMIVISRVALNDLYEYNVGSAQCVHRGRLLATTVEPLDVLAVVFALSQRTLDEVCAAFDATTRRVRFVDESYKEDNE